MADVWPLRRLSKLLYSDCLGKSITTLTNSVNLCLMAQKHQNREVSCAYVHPKWG